MAGLPKKYARMGFKRGWAAFKRKSKIKTRRVQTMTRRKKGGFRRFYKRTRNKAKSFLNMGNIIKIGVGVGLCVLYEVFVSPMIPLDSMMKNIIELAVGLILAGMSSMPMPVRAFGTALAVVNLYSILVPVVAGFKEGSSPSSMAWG